MQHGRFTLQFLSPRKSHGSADDYLHFVYAPILTTSVLNSCQGSSLLRPLQAKSISAQKARSAATRGAESRRKPVSTSLIRLSQICRLRYNSVCATLPFLTCKVSRVFNSFESTHKTRTGSVVCSKCARIRSARFKSPSNTCLLKSKRS